MRLTQVQQRRVPSRVERGRTLVRADRVLPVTASLVYVPDEHYDLRVAGARGIGRVEMLQRTIVIRATGVEVVPQRDVRVRQVRIELERVLGGGLGLAQVLRTEFV